MMTPKHGAAMRSTRGGLGSFVAVASMLCMISTPGAAAPRSRFTQKPPACPIIAPNFLSNIAHTPQGMALTLAGRIGMEVTKQPAGASTDDLEAAIVFAISQAGVPNDTALAAIGTLFDCSYGQRNFQAALQRVNATLAQRRFTRGTSALAGAAGSAFTDFSLNVGGGTSNYTR
jgi:hypothetical protein